MVERILGITSTPRAANYSSGDRFMGDTAKQKQELDFQSILNKKMKESARAHTLSDAYKIDLGRTPQR